MPKCVLPQLIEFPPSFLLVYYGNTSRVFKANTNEYEYRFLSSFLIYTRGSIILCVGLHFAFPT